MAPQLAGFAVDVGVSAETNSGLDGILAELSLALNSGCPATETIFCRDAVRMCGYRPLSPSIRFWRDHSAGRSLSRTTPIP